MGRRLRALIALGALVLGCGEPGTPAPERIILIVVDTLRRDHLSVYGGDVRTPNLARLARRGLVHPNAVASFHQTSMSMGALFTGRTPSLESGESDRTVKWISSNWCGMARFLSEGEEVCVPSGIQTLGELMREQGYWTLGIATNPFTYRPAGFDRGFDQWVELEGTHEAPLMITGKRNLDWAMLRSGKRTTDAAIQALEKRPTDRFFLYVHYMDVHDYAMARRSYGASVELMDRNLGRLLGAMDSEGLLEDAVIVVTSDHGERLPGESHVLVGPPHHTGNPSFESLLRVPLIWVGPGPDPETLIRSEDVFRLLARTAGAEAAAPEALAPGELLVTEMHYRTYREGRWKSFWKRDGDSFHLVDLESDPDERRDVAAEHPAVVASHRRRVQELSEALAAPDAPSREIIPRYEELLRRLGYIE